MNYWWWCWSNFFKEAGLFLLGKFKYKKILTKNKLISVGSAFLIILQTKKITRGDGMKDKKDITICTIEMAGIERCVDQIRSGECSMVNDNKPANTRCKIVVEKTKKN